MWKDILFSIALSLDDLDEGSHLNLTGPSDVTLTSMSWLLFVNGGRLTTPKNCEYTFSTTHSVGGIAEKYPETYPSVRF